MTAQPEPIFERLHVGPDMMTATEARMFLGIPQTSFLRLLRAGAFPGAVRRRKNWVIPRAEVMAYEAMKE